MTDQAYECMELADTPGAKRARLVGQGAYYVDGIDHLQITCFNTATGVSLLCSGRALLLDGRIQSFSFPLTPTTNGAASRAFSAMAQGWILDAVVTVTAGTPTNLSTFVQIQVVRGAQGLLEVARLQQGFVTANIAIRFPGELGSSSGSSSSTARVIVGTLPGAGVNISETVPAGHTWTICAVSFTLTADAVAGNREAVLRFLDSLNNILYEIGADSSLTANNAHRYSYGQATYLKTNADGDSTVMPIPFIRLPAGSKMTTNIHSFDAGDQLTAPIYSVQEE